MHFFDTCVCVVLFFCLLLMLLHGNTKQSISNETKWNEKKGERVRRAKVAQKDTFRLIEDDKITVNIDDTALYLCVVLHIVQAPTIYLFILHGVRGAFELATFSYHFTAYSHSPCIIHLSFVAY